MQEEMSRANKRAWETKAYEAWFRKNGSLEDEARRLSRDPRHALRQWLKYLGDPRGKRVLNLLGSRGAKAIPLAILGGDVTVVDISEDNRRYATEVAAAVGVPLKYICADAVNIPDEESLGTFDIVLMETGILHYFGDLGALFAVVHRRLAAGGRFVLNDFHPLRRVLTNLDNPTNPWGHYFNDTVLEGEVAFAHLVPEEDRPGLPHVLIRSWTVGDIVTAVASTGLSVRAFEEWPNTESPPTPEFFTLVADKVESALPPLYP